ncbi:DJ-1/PfpI family protein [[Mycoplasma] mobile]|uniref:Putative intracellular protease/amidase and/or 4-methyl-5 (B-hydroxyethyl)-thiazole monophosphate biosynthesis protein n=1 Tax=Mycoplasma mobile (strain ATCC 43663 / 163K / NCTC 11711) TaxID=267748 RepID=Q6KH56_MYCM1|nr:DJ-1/PfpI family protein [[Mycoplasma] mobile]AAT28075.1 putative intracellular protease/amidase and/or 4-methyl-5 (b-hydroxyethyl)-thiazole monophosphate biosynthesis protein [Mycoplasma mobile 163K]
MKLLTLVLDEFQDIELINVNATLQRGNFLEKNDFYNPHNKKVVTGQFNIANVNTITQINENDYDAIFIPGGKAAQHLRKDSKSLNLIESFIKKNKIIIMICDAPNAIYESNLLKKDIIFTSYPVESILKLKPIQRNEDNVVYYKNFFSAKSAAFSIELGLKVIEVLKSKQESERVSKNLWGN